MNHHQHPDQAQPRWRLARTLGAALGLAALLGASPWAQAQTSTITRVSSFEYNAEGLLVREVVEPDLPQDCLSTTYSYDGFGNKQTVSTAACAGASGTVTWSATTPRTAATVFAAQTVVIGGVSYSSPAGAFPTSSTNALGQSESKQYDPRFGAVTQLVGPNGGTTTWAYDGFGRKTSERRADTTSTRWEYRFCGQAQADGAAAPCAANATLNGHTLVWYAVEANFASDGTTLLGPKKLQIHDSLDRVVRVQTLDFHGNVVVQDTQYNALGQTQQKSNLYRLSGGTPAWTSFQYDAIGRATREDAPEADGSGGRAVTTFAYNGLIITVTNAAGQTKTTHKNAAGQTARVVDHLGGQVVYSYDALGQLVQTNAAGSITRIGYNQRGQKAWMEDPAMGKWEYAYNAFGELVSQTDSLGQGSSMTYDVLGRMTQRSEPDLVSTWHYDRRANGTACGAGIGKLCEATTTNGYQRVHTYDAIGRPTVTGTKLDSSTTLATMSQVYDLSTGRVLSQTWPTGYRAAYSYTASGFLSTVTGGGVAGHAQTVTFQVLAMNAQGAITQYRQGNNVTTVKNVDDVTGKVRSVQATLAGQAAGNVFNHSYGYDALGNLMSRNDANTGVNENFQYDTLNRLSLYTALGGGLPGTQNTQVLYDAAGNIKYKSDVGYYHYDPLRPNRLTSITLAQTAGWSTGVMGAVSFTNTGTRNLFYGFDDGLPGARAFSPGSATKWGNGNLMYTVSQDDTTGRHTVRWETYTSFNMPKEILFGSLTNTANPTSTVADRTLTFVYGPEHQRVRQDVRLSTNVPSHMEAGTTWYYNGADSQGLSYEKEIKANGTTEHKHYVNAGGITFALYVQREGALNGKPATSISYFHHDHLGSIAAVSNQAGVVVERMAYDPWGKRRFPNGTNDRLDALYGVNTDRGYTMHEHLDEMGVIHMNGRIFDPLIGRFMSADPHIQFAGNLQSYNRYSYVLNNPLSYTDPSGYFLKDLFKSKMKFLGNPSMKNAFNFVAALPGQRQLDNYVLANPWAYAVGSYLAYFYAGSYGVALHKSYYTYVATGSASEAFKAGAISYGTSVAFTAAGQYATNPVASYAAHAAIGCASAAAQGGNCGTGATSALFGKYVTVQVRGIGGDDYIGIASRGVATVIAGGIGSVITGGTFANGAETAAYGYLFNELASQTTKAQRGYGSKSPSWNDTREMWQNGGGSTLVVDIDTLSFHGLENDATWKPGTVRLFSFQNGADFAVYGTVDVYKIDSQTFRVLDNTYNNEQLPGNGTISRYVRNGLTRLNEVLHGSGAEFKVQFDGVRRFDQLGRRY